MMKIERRAHVFSRNDVLLVEPLHRTTMVWLSAGPVREVPRTSTPKELGATVRMALNDSGQRVPHPTDWKTFSPPILEAAGLRSWRALQKSATMCHVELYSEELRVVPTAKDMGGYIPIKELALSVATSAVDDELGAAVQAVLAACR